MWVKKVWNIFRWVVVVYVAIGVAIYFFSDRILFRPQAFDPDYRFQFKQRHSEHWLYSVGAKINYIKFYPKDSSKGIVLYFHGNRKNVLHYLDRVKLFTDAGYELWMPDYPRFGKSTGTLNEETLYSLAEGLYRQALAQQPAERLVIYGRSIGSGVAAYLAARRSCKAVVLETPYYSMASLGRRYFPIYPAVVLQKFSLPVHEYLETVQAPITVLHGTDDGVVPFNQSRKLKSAHPKINLVRIEGGSHNDLDSYPLFQQTLQQVLQ